MCSNENHVFMLPCCGWEIIFLRGEGYVDWFTSIVSPSTILFISILCTDDDDVKQNPFNTMYSGQYMYCIIAYLKKTTYVYKSLMQKIICQYKLSFMEFPYIILVILLFY